MSLTLVTAPTVEPLTLADAKLQCRVFDSDHNEDDLLDSLIVAARQYAELYTGRALCTQTWDDKRDTFPCYSDETIWLPKPPVASVTSLSYIDTAGATQVWAASNYLTDLPSGTWAGRARITPAYAVTYPLTRSVMNAVTIRVVCGYGAASAVPEPIKAAMRLLIGTWFENRSAVNVGTSVTPMPMAVDALLWPFKVFE